ncbi:MAG: helix-turn-helix domain-containing protein [Candidatus Palauibacterales bacterium]|nr:helix-turn-helix domain-containing protein [Candidatus Palauibacterales bacterium]
MDEEKQGGGSDAGEVSSRQRILDAALRLFSQHGYDETSVAALARSADVSKGLVYHYFDTKRDVLEAVMARGSERLEAALDRAGSGSSGAPPPAAVMEILGMVAEDLPWWRLLFRLRMQPELGREIGLTSLGDSIENALERSLREAGYDSPRRDALALAVAVEGAAQRYVLDPDGYPLVETAEAMVSRYLEPR